MKKIFFFLLVFSSLILFSQEQFNVHYSHDFVSTARNVFELSDTSYATIGSGNIDGNSKIVITITDVFGQVQETKHYGADGWDFSYGTKETLIKTKDGGFALSGVGRVGDSMGTDSIYVFLMKFDENFDSLTTYSYLHDNIYLWIYGMCQSPDSSFALVGRTDRRDNGYMCNNSEGLFLKVDHQGNYLWHKTYGADSYANGNDDFRQVIPTHNGHYLVSGLTKSWQTHIGSYSDKGDIWLVRIDGGGTQHMNRRYGHPDYSDRQPSGLLMSSDTSYYLSGAKTIYKISNYNIKQSYLLKLNKNFQPIFERYYGEPSLNNSFNGIIENEDGDLILSAYFKDIYAVQNERGLLYKLNTNGDSIWKRQYVAADTFNLNSNNYPHSVRQTADGGYIFTGRTSYSSLNPDAQIWLVKTDQYGCDGTGDFWDDCSDLMMNKYIINKPFSFFPNPASKFIVVESQASKSIEIYNLTGKLIHLPLLQCNDLTSQGAESISKIDISPLESGIYIIKIDKQAQKLIVE